MAWLLRSKTRAAVTGVSSLGKSSVSKDPSQSLPFSGVIGSSSASCFRNCARSSTDRLATSTGTTRLGMISSLKENPILRLDASVSSLGVAQEFENAKVGNLSRTDSEIDLFEQMKQRFLNFKKHKYLIEAEHFQNLAEAQSPKFLVIACVDSRVCPSNILGFQPGEAFMVRNVANFVPPLQNGPSETNAALEFAVNTLEVENIFVIGHSSCAGIEALMNMKDSKNLSLVEKWVGNAEAAKLRAKADATHLTFHQQCKQCEKESINLSLQNLLTYPWIRDKVRKELLRIHGGYYDFLNCTFQKWTLELKEPNGGLSVKDEQLWC